MRPGQGRVRVVARARPASSVLHNLPAASTLAVLQALDRFQLLYVRFRPETITDGSDERRFWSTNSARLNPALQRDLMNSHFLSGLGCCKFTVSQRYTYSSKQILSSRK